MSNVNDIELMNHAEGRLTGMRTTRYSWWVHARELADYMLPRRYRWLITPNAANRGSPINQRILDSTATIAARNLASGMKSGMSSPTRLWFKLKIGKIDSTQTGPISLWLAEVQRLMMMIFHASNFYTAVGVWYFDVVIFPTGALLIYEDYEDVIRCVNPCFGEYYVDVDGKYKTAIFYREFTLTIAQLVHRFGYDNCSLSVRRSYDEGKATLSREVIVAHAIEPNDNPQKYGIPSHFAFRELYWEHGGSTNPQGTNAQAVGFLRKKGFYEKPHVIGRWDVTGNDAYGRSPAMDALPDVRQLQQEVRRKAQAIDKTVNPPMVADIQLQNKPASLLPGGTTYISGMMQTGNSGFKSVYDRWQPGINYISEDLMEIRQRIKQIFFNDILQPISQYQTRSNVTLGEIDARRAEALLLIGTVIDRLTNEGLKDIVERTYAIAARAGVFPPPPPEIEGQDIDVEFVSMFALAQAATETAGIERLFQLAGGLVGVVPEVMDNIDTDYGIEKYSHLLNNDPKLIRSPEALAQVRMRRQQQMAAQAAAEQAQQLAAGAKTLSETDVGGGVNALQRMIGNA